MIKKLACLPMFNMAILVDLSRAETSQLPWTVLDTNALTGISISG